MVSTGVEFHAIFIGGSRLLGVFYQVFGRTLSGKKIYFLKKFNPILIF